MTTKTITLAELLKDSANVQADIRQAVEKSHEQKQRASQLLDAAKRAVEIAIEDSEAAALAYLAEVAPPTH